MIDYGHSRRDERDPGVLGKEDVEEEKRSRDENGKLCLTACSLNERAQLDDMRATSD